MQLDAFSLPFGPETVPKKGFTMAHAYSLAPRGRATTAVTFHFQVCFVNSNVVVRVGCS